MDREGLIKEFSLKIASKVVREFEGNDNYTVHDLRNYTELLLNELVSKNELLHLVSQQSELLIDYMKWFDDNKDMYYEVSNKEMIDKYIKSINCA